MRNRKFASILLLFVLFLCFSCVKDKPSILKVFVKSAQNGGDVINAPVRIIGKVNMDTPEFKKVQNSNNQGVAIFKLDDFFSSYPEDKEKVAYFDVYVQDTMGIYQLGGDTRAKAHITSTETIYLKY